MCQWTTQQPHAAQTHVPANPYKIQYIRYAHSTPLGYVRNSVKLAHFANSSAKMSNEIVGFLR